MVRKSRLAVIGAGYVGLTTAACLAFLGHDVCCADSDATLVEDLRNGKISIREPGLDDLVAVGLANRHLQFSQDSCDAVGVAEATFLCVPTPQGLAGAADISEIESAIAKITPALRSDSIVVIKSTAPPGTASRIASQIGRFDVGIASNPEFLREGKAVDDFLHPDRILIGAEMRNG
jgi:UDPglucose 6-dehydrogenase